MTPQAVGQQIKLLEDSLQVTLFERKGRSIEPTEAAVLLAHYVEAGFAEFAEGVRRITRSGYRDRINLNTSPYFATNYLLHHLSEFREEMPNLDLRLTTMIDMPDFARDDIDMTVQWGYGRAEDHDCALLVPDPKIICCTPGIGAQIAGLGLHDVLKQVDIDPGDTPDAPIHFGGPVETRRGFVLHTLDWGGQDTIDVAGKWALSGTLDALRAIASGNGPSRWLVALGYAGWGAGQLDEEMTRHGWLNVSDDDAMLFDTGIADRWTRGFNAAGIDPRLLGTQSGHA